MSSQSLALLLYRIPSVVVVLDAPVPGDDGEARISHYARSYYVVAESADDAIALIRLEEERDGASLIEFDPPVPTEVGAAPRELRQKLQGDRGIKWKSGRAFFPPT